MLYVFQSRPVYSTPFLHANMVTIALDVGLQNQVAHLIPLWGNVMLDVDHCMNKQLIRFRLPNELHLLINNEVVHYFVLPNHERTSVHNHDNWLYQLEGQEEAPTPPQTPLTHEFHPAPLSNVSSSSVSPSTPQGNDIDYELNALRREDTALRIALQNQTDIDVLPSTSAPIEHASESVYTDGEIDLRERSPPIHTSMHTYPSPYHSAAHAAHNEICELLGFKISRDAFTEFPRDNFIQYDLDNF
ncbi:hypothetical protein KIW84_010311 [Lathyrus oleraceus]|uniref:Uncharacterized protein n=1 Tax=Pisum sativum TaxID=3888 RepID=A0A9D4YJL1_PEA|nr:hypothetical protein KIW84_010311 [Pisum sativum]